MPAPRQTPIGLQLTRSARRVERAFNEALVAEGGSAPVWTILLTLKSGSARNQREIAERVGIRGATLTHHLTAMETHGLLARRRDPTNRRVHIVELTEAGEALFLTLRVVAADFDRRLRHGLSDDQVASVRAALQQLETNAAIPARPGTAG